MTRRGEQGPLCHMSKIVREGKNKKKNQSGPAYAGMVIRVASREPIISGYVVVLVVLLSQLQSYSHPPMVFSKMVFH